MNAVHANGGANRTSRHWPAPAEVALTAVDEAPEAHVAYQVMSRIAGSAGDARYLVKRLDAGTLAELRVLSGDRGAGAGLVRAFTEQAERVATAARGCPGIASVHECERVARGALLLTVERPQGPTLRELLRAEGRLAVPRAVRIAIQIAEALEQAHALGLVHGGLDPDNVVLTGPDETVSLTYFGFDRLLGTPARGGRHLRADERVYQAPEQAAGKSTAQSDIYALGALLHEMLAGAPAEIGKSARLRPGALRERRPDVPHSLEHLLLQALQPAARRRPANISAVCTELWAELSPYGRPMLPEPGPSWTGTLLRRPGLLAASIGAAVALTAAAGALVSWLGPGSTGPTARTEPVWTPAAPASRPVGRDPWVPPIASPSRTGERETGADGRRAVEPTAAAAPTRAEPPRATPTEQATAHRVTAPEVTAPARANEPARATDARRGSGPARGADTRPAIEARRAVEPRTVVEPARPTDPRPAAGLGRSAERSAPPSRDGGEDPGAIIDWLLDEGARQHR